jgi:hypothetical protein
MNLGDLPAHTTPPSAAAAVSAAEAAAAAQLSRPGLTLTFAICIGLLALLAALGYLLVESVSLSNDRAQTYLLAVAPFLAGLIVPSPINRR